MICHSEFDDLLRLPFARGGRAATGVADCLGITLEMARRRGLPLQDPWDRVRHLHLTGQQVDHLFPPGWILVPDGQPQDDDVALLHCAAELGAGYVLGGLLYSSTARHGAFRADVARFQIQQLWRFAS